MLPRGMATTEPQATRVRAEAAPPIAIPTREYRELVLEWMRLLRAPIAVR